MKLDVYYIEKDIHPDHMLHLFATEGDTCFVEVLNKYDDELRFPCEHVPTKELERFYEVSTKDLWDEWVRENAKENIKYLREEMRRYQMVLADLKEGE